MIPHIQQVFIQNFKSIEKAEPLEPFTVLVGANGSGKSNFVDALEFLGDCVSMPIEDAIADRGGDSGVACALAGVDRRIGLRILLSLADNIAADYAFEIDLTNKFASRVLREHCVISKGNGGRVGYRVEDGQFVSSSLPGVRPYVHRDELALSLVAGAPELRPLYDFIRSMRFYAISPQPMRKQWQPIESGEVLRRDGSNATAVFRRLATQPEPRWRSERIVQMLRLIAAGVEDVSVTQQGGGFGDAAFGLREETLSFQHDQGTESPVYFPVSAMSDGTLRALGVLLAGYQLGQHSLVCIEEPEAVIHPGAAEVLFDALKGASRDRQILVTTHSADILDQKEMETRDIRVVTMELGRTFLAHVSESGRSLIRDKLATPGELLRIEELHSDLEETKQQLETFDLFSDPFANTIQTS